MLNIEQKEDSAQKMASAHGKPTKNYLFAEEVNQIVSEINNLGAVVTTTYTKAETDYLLQQIDKKVVAGYKGIATQVNAPTPYSASTYPNGLFERYIVNTPITSPNSWGNIVVTQEEFNANTVFFNVTNGVVSKELSVKPVADPAKLPLYSAIKSANIVAGTQFIDDENENIQYRVKTGQTLLTTELPANVVGTKIEYIAGYSDTKSILNSGEKSGNLIDPSKFKGVLYTINSVTQKIQEAANVNWLSTHIEGGLIGGNAYYLQGLGTMTNGAALIIFADATNTHISTILKQDFTGSFIAPLNTANTYIRITNEINIGLNPTESVYKDSVQLKEGDMETEFEEFGKFYFNAENIKGLPEVISDNQTIKNIEPMLVKSGNLIDPSKFKGVLYRINSVTQKIQEAVNANALSVHIEGVEENTQYFLQGLGVVTNAVSAMVIFADATNTHISTILKQDFTGSFISPAGTNNIYALISREANSGINVSESPYVSTAQLKEGNAATDFEKFGKFYFNAENIKGLPEVITLENFIELFPYTTAYNGTLITHTVATYYEKLSNGMYIGHKLYYNKFAYEDVTETGFFEGGEVVRYAGAGLYTYNAENNVMTGAGQAFITTVESEFVMSSGGWIGGYHGHENLVKVYFLVDGIPYNMNGNMDFTASGLIACKQFSYVQKSIFKHYSNLSDLCERSKLTEFKNGGYVTQTRFKALQNFSAMAYPGIVSMGKVFAKVTTDNGDTFTPTGTTNFLIDEKMTRSVIYAGSNYYGKITNEIKGDLDAQGYVLLWDRASDTKYYRQLKSVDFVVGDIFETETTVTIIANE